MVKKDLRVKICNLMRRTAFTFGCKQHLVLTFIGIGDEMPHIGDIHYVLNLIPGVTQCPGEEILEDVSSKIPDVLIVINGRATAIEKDLRRMNRDEILHRAGEGIIESNWLWCG